MARVCPKCRRSSLDFNFSRGKSRTCPLCGKTFTAKTGLPQSKWKYGHPKRLK